MKLTKTKKKSTKIKKASHQDAKITSSPKRPKKLKKSKASKGPKRFRLLAPATGNETVTQPLVPAPEAEPEEPTGATSLSVKELGALSNGVTAVYESPAQPETQPTPTQVPAETKTEQIQGPAAGRRSVSYSPAAFATDPAPLTLLGFPALHGADGSRVTGKPAEAVAYLHLNMLTNDGVKVSQALWPTRTNEGHAARARRTRTTRAVKEALPETFRVEEGKWIIDPLTTDLDQILAALAPGNPENTLSACNAIESPLVRCAAWADEPRAQIVRQFREVLEGVMDRAFDHDQFEIAKAARQAIKKL